MMTIDDLKAYLQEQIDWLDNNFEGYELLAKFSNTYRMTNPLRVGNRYIDLDDPCEHLGEDEEED